jgi:hypothetical protein
MLSVQMLVDPKVAQPAVPITAFPKLPVEAASVLLKGYSAISVCPFTPIVVEKIKIIIPKTLTNRFSLVIIYDFLFRCKFMCSTFNSHIDFL